MNRALLRRVDELEGQLAASEAEVRNLRGDLVAAAAAHASTRASSKTWMRRYSFLQRAMRQALHDAELEG